MPSIKSFGTQAAAIGTEHTLLDTSDNHSGVLVVDLTPMQGGDIVEIRVYDETSEAVERLADEASYGPALPSPALIRTFPTLFPRGARYTIKQTAGTGRSFRWEVRAV